MCLNVENFYGNLKAYLVNLTNINNILKSNSKNKRAHHYYAINIEPLKDKVKFILNLHWPISNLRMLLKHNFLEISINTLLVYKSTYLYVKALFWIENVLPLL